MEDFYLVAWHHTVTTQAFGTILGLISILRSERQDDDFGRGVSVMPRIGVS